jgi:hypothetical protein
MTLASGFTGASLGVRRPPYSSRSAGRTSVGHAWHGKRLVAASVLAIATSVAGVSRATPEDDARAETLFNTAKFLQSKGQMSEACSLFAQSKAITPGIGVTLHLADCYERLGRPVEAWSQFRQAEQMAHARNDDKRTQIAHARAQALERQLERLTVVVSSTPHDDWQVTVDGARLPMDHLNAQLAVDPGDHEVVVKVPGRPVRTLHVRTDTANPSVSVGADEPLLPKPLPVATVAVLQPGSQQAPSLSTASTALQPPGETAAELPAQSHEEVPVGSAAEGPRSGIAARTWVELGLVGLAVAGGGLGAFFLVRQNVLAGHDCSCDPSLERQASAAATISFAAGGAALASSVLLYLTGQGRKSDSGWVLSPSPMAGGAGALLYAGF